MYRVICLSLIMLIFSQQLIATEYQRNKAVPVEKVLFGQVDSVRHIDQQELIQDRRNGWTTFGAALIGGTIGHQFGSGSGQDVATVLGAVIGASLAEENQSASRVVTIRLVELLVTADSGEQYLVLQDFDPNMIFHQGDEIRMVYLANDMVRIDQQM